MSYSLPPNLIADAEKGSLGVLDLIRAAEQIKASQGLLAVLALYDIWVRHNQGNPLLYAVLFNFSVAQMDHGDLDAARQSLEEALALNLDFMPAYINLGRLHERQGNIKEAAIKWSAALERMAAVTGSAITHKTTALNQIARVMEDSQQDETAETMLRQSLELDRHQREALQHLVALRQRQCEWPVVEPWERVPRDALLAGMSPLSVAAHADDPMLHLATAWNYNRLDVGLPGAGFIESHWAARERGGDKPLRIGYLSSDLREHAVGHLTAELFEEHDANAVELFAYSCGIKANDALCQRIKSRFEHWTDISDLSDAEAARRIADDGIQILIDLNGYTREGRTKLVALRPAPVIVNWLGYPGTMGSPYHHYLVADDWLISQESEKFYSEKVLRLPCYQPNDRKRVVADAKPTRAEAGLPDEAMVLCCFNGLHKLTRVTFESWLEILQRVPGSVLWLLSGAEGAQNRLRGFAAAKGLDPARLIFAGKLANPFHLARYPLADLFLDTFPYGAHTTASDALWMGVPVLTLSGRSFASRVCGSLVRSAGLPELVCSSRQEYVGRAVALGRDREKLVSYRRQLQEGRDSCTLFDTTLLARHLEELYRRMWQDFEKGALPKPDLANLDVYLEASADADHDAMDLLAVEDYENWWRDKLAKRHRFREIPPDARLWRPYTRLHNE
ncbi:MAG: O-linked N-acetylglucosamine transferase [Rhodospirillales bacterium]|jgi:predicted O-linked N-acetylglucosamine transferase (SPINDLY family)